MKAEVGENLPEVMQTSGDLFTRAPHEYEKVPEAFMR